MRVPLSKPLFDGAEQRAICEVLDSGWVMQGSRVAELERRFAAFVGTPWAIATSSCTTALHLAMRAVGVGPGDEVIVPSLTWVATAAAVEECGAETVFADSRLDTYNMDIEHARSLITSRTRAIVAVSLFGLAADLPVLTKLCDEHGIILIEDAACSLGATCGGRQSGGFGRLACFSLHPRKSITTGEGGVIVGADARDEGYLRRARSHGIILPSEGESLPPHEMGDVELCGYNYRLTDLQASLGLAQFDKLSDILRRRREIASIYTRAFSDLEGINTPFEPASCRHSYQSYVLLVTAPTGDDAESERLRNAMMIQLERRGVATRPGTHAVHSLSYFRDKYKLHRRSLPNAYRAMTRTIALPLYPSMTQSETCYVIESVRAVYEEIFTSVNSGACGGD